MTNYNEDYQYDSCSSRGICSMNPRTSSLQEILILYLCLTSYYVFKNMKYGQTNKKIKNLILNTISIMVSNPEFSENDFEAIMKGFNTELPKIIQEYVELSKKNNETPQYTNTPIKFNKPGDIINSIKLGQKEYIKKSKILTETESDLYKIVFVLAKSICTNILDLESFGADEGYRDIILLLNSLNGKNNESELKKSITDAAKSGRNLMYKLAEVKNKYYGKQRPKEVSYSTSPGKAILVVGSNIRELEIILDAFKDDDVSIYTHDEMMLAHTYPAFEKYNNLKGQFGQGMENCLLDFATFPGPIILTRHSLYNVEHLYRGRLYTTDFAYSKGVIPIQNNDFSKVKEILTSMKGFKTGKICKSEIVGFEYDKTISEIDERIKTGNYNRIFILGLNGYTKEDRLYFEKFLKFVPDDIFVISLSTCIERKNVFCVNACFDSFATLKISEYILDKYNIKTDVFFPKCDKHTILKMIYLSSKCDVYAGKCTPLTLNPNLILTLNKVFNIKGLSSPKKDLETILNKK